MLMQEGQIIAYEFRKLTFGRTKLPHPWKGVVGYNSCFKNLEPLFVRNIVHNWKWSWKLKTSNHAI
jgi:hypothetical protein